MKTIRISVDDAYYESLMAHIEKIPSDKVQIQQVIQDETNPHINLEEASDYLLKKNATLYEVLAIHEQVMDEYAPAFERLAKG